MYPFRQQTPRWLYWLLQLACAYLLLSELMDIPQVLSMREELAKTVPGSYGSRMFLRPFVISALVVSAWIRFFRTERDGARVMALMAVTGLLLASLVMWLNSTVNDLHYPIRMTVGYPLAGLVFLMYVILGREHLEPW